MCGINGVINFSQEDQEYYSTQIKKINRQLNYRGPDNLGFWKDKYNYCSMGHTRLSILDLNNRSNQPMIDNSGNFVICFNGEIYNFLELKHDLENKDIKFKTTSDTEVFLEGFKFYGKDILDKIDGMFAVAIYNIKEKKLFLARDRAGEKPLYYISTNKFFAFCSELKPLLNYNKKINFSISDNSFFEFLSLRYVPYENTLINQIKKLEPGCFINISKSNIKLTRYFAYNIRPHEYEKIDEYNYFLNYLFEALKKSVKKRLVADVKVGTFLSGGIDSSLTSAIATKEFNLNLETFSIGFENYKNSEHNNAKEIAKIIGSNHNEIILDEKITNDTFDKIGLLMDEPNADRSLIPAYIVSKFAKEKVTVALSGDGADELFGGYPRHWQLRNFIQKQQLPKNPSNLLESYITHLLPVFNFPALRKFFLQFSENFIEKFSRHFINEQRSVSASLRNLDFETYLTCVLSKVDIMSMKNSLEVRTPFLDKDLINYSQFIPDNLIWNGKYPKLALRKLCSKYLPAEIYTLPKLGFGLPIKLYSSITNNLDIINESNEIYKKSNFFSADNQFYSFLKSNYQKNSNSFWLYIVLAQWLKSIQLNL